MGEIGIDHRTFLYHLQFWQVRRIIRGYRRRNRLIHQLIATSAWASIHVMRKPDKTAVQMFPDIFDDEDDDTPDAPPLTDEDRQELEELMRANPFL